ncbi:hypothetical protein TI05_10185 [Achromatium sp. WMS3]|nr:hypothetical protein TI05_10185 [Achromatium sp. WMS3]
MSNKVELDQDVAVTTNSPNDNRTKISFGYVSAYPHEYLIHFRHGKFHQKTSGQGASCFKRFQDTVFIIPTSLKEIVFQANQLSKDNVDLRLRGMAVYHIKEPLKIYSLINFSDRQRAEEKLAKMIGDLCRSTVKWLVANMEVDECMRKRKEEIADTLKQEISKVVADADNGWGIEILTIDIQDIYIQDDEIFTAMQAKFKADKVRESEIVQLETSRTLEVKRLDNDRQLAEYRKNNELEKARIAAELKNEQLTLAQQTEAKEYGLKMFHLKEKEQLERYQQEQKIERDKQAKLLNIDTAQAIEERTQTQVLAKLKQDAHLEAVRIQTRQEQDEKQFALDRYRVEQNESLADYKQTQNLNRERQQAQTKHEIEQQAVETNRLIHEEEVATLKKRIKVENQITPTGLERQFIDNALPKIAKSLGKSLQNARISIVQGEGGLPFQMLVNEIIGVLRSRLERLESHDGE